MKDARPPFKSYLQEENYTILKILPNVHEEVLVSVILDLSLTAKASKAMPSYLRGWPNGLEHRNGDRVVLSSNPDATTLLRNFGNSVYPALPVSFGGDTKSRRSLLSGVFLCRGK